MANTFSYTLTYAGTPFVLDQSQIVRLSPKYEQGRQDERYLTPRKWQPEAGLIEELNRIIPFEFLQDFSLPSNYPGRNLGALANAAQIDPQPNPELPIGCWYYPYGASRWSVFRGVATADMAFAMLPGCSAPQTFIMRVVPIGKPAGTDIEYTITTPMQMLPPRTLAELGGDFDGLYLITLVDERYYFQGTPVSLQIKQATTWTSLINAIATNLGVTITVPSIADVYQQPEPDSQFWANAESCPQLLDAIAYNIGTQIVRNYDGTYEFQTPIQSQALVDANRGDANTVVRIAGGDIFNSGVQGNIHDFNDARNAVVPTTIYVTYPKYVVGNDPVPHLVNPRYNPQRPSCHYEESYGDVHIVPVPINSVNLPWQNGPVTPLVSGLTGTSEQFLHTTAKALYNTEAAAVSGGSPLNNSGLNALAVQLAVDRYNAQVAAALDEVYPGTLAWNPEGLHDVVYTFSATNRLASTRVMRPEWNISPIEFQYSTPTISGLNSIPYTNTPIGVGGPSVAQSWRMFTSGAQIATTHNGSITSGATTFTFNAIDNFPTQNRWKGTVQSGQSDEEIVLFEGTSGTTSVGVVFRGIDGSYQQAHNNGASIVYQQRQADWGKNLISAEKMMFTYPGAWTSGGVQEEVLVPQTQTVICLSQSGTAARSPAGINTIDHWSGQVTSYDPTQQSGSQFPKLDNIWVVERNGLPLSSGKRYDGQFVGFSKSGLVAPVYAVNESVASSGSELVSGHDIYPSSVNTATVTAGIIGAGTVTTAALTVEGPFRQQPNSGAITSDLNNWNFSGVDYTVYYEGVLNGSYDLTGLKVNQLPGRMIDLINSINSVGAWTITHDDPASSSGQRFWFSGNLVMPTGTGSIWKYTNAGWWVCIGRTVPN